MRLKSLREEVLDANLELVRGGQPGSQQSVQIFFNLDDQAQPLPAIAAGQTLLFSSENKRYLGSRLPHSPPGQLLPFECVVYGPAAWRPLAR